MGRAPPADAVDSDNWTPFRHVAGARRRCRPEYSFQAAIAHIYVISGFKATREGCIAALPLGSTGSGATLSCYPGRIRAPFALAASTPSGRKAGHGTGQPVTWQPRVFRREFLTPSAPNMEPGRGGELPAKTIGYRALTKNRHPNRAACANLAPAAVASASSAARNPADHAPRYVPSAVACRAEQPLLQIASSSQTT